MGTEGWFRIAARPTLRNLYQLHLAVTAAMEDKQVTASIAKDEQVAVAEFGFFDCFLDGHGPNGYGIGALEDVGLDHSRGGRKRMHGDLGARLGGPSIFRGRFW